MKKVLALALVLISTSAYSTFKRPTVTEVAEQAGNFNTLLTALKATGLDKTIDDSKGLTIFAPTDAAFNKLPAGAVQALLNDKETLSQILLYHVSGEKLKAKKVLRNKEIKTLQGKTIAVSQTAEGAFLNDSKIVATDIKSKNGIVHVIDSVLLFDENTPNNTFTTEQDVDVEKYMGLWYEYARYENNFQKECLGTTAEYSLEKTPITRRTYVRVINSCELANGELQVGKARAFVVNKETNATLKVSFVPVLNYFGVFAGDYNILKLGPDYEYALVGDKARSTFWILTREKQIPEALYQELLDVAEEKGFRRELIKKSPVFTR